MAAGDCIKFVFDPIQAYTSKGTSYKPVPSAITCSNSNTAITCERLNDNEFRITLNAATSDLKTTVGAFTNPLST
jgi:hypothetical protein